VKKSKHPDNSPGTFLTAGEAARHCQVCPAALKRWIRAGQLRSQKAGTQHLIDEAELEQLLGEDEMLPLPEAWKTTFWGEPQPNWVKIIRRSRLLS